MQHQVQYELHQGAEKLREELQRQKDVHMRLQEQLNFRASDKPMEYRVVGEQDPNYVKIPDSSEGKIRIDPFDGSELCKVLELDL